MAKKPTVDVPAESVNLFDKAIEGLPGIERKGATMPYTSLNGHMFAFLTKEGELALRLPDDSREAFIKKYKTTLAEQHGVVLKEYVMVPDKLLRNTKELKPYFKESYSYISSLKPKPTKKAKK
jgi:TfoX/Sxy family transcriptional regulator of competence genes